MAPPIPTDPSLFVSSLDRAGLATSLVLGGYVLSSLLLLARGAKRSWLGGPDHADRADADPARDRGESLPESGEEVPS